MKQSFIFSRKDCQVQKVHLFEEHQRQWEVEGGILRKFSKSFSTDEFLAQKKSSTTTNVQQLVPLG